MRILIFHGYLLAGTGSNVYNARLAEALAGLGHEVHLLSQDHHPERQPFVDAVGDWDAGALRVQVLREPVRCTVYRPNIGSLLPVYVLDRYEGMHARLFSECGEDQIDAYLQANAGAVREVAQRAAPHAALANHLVMGPAILARGLGGKVPYAVKVHGSALEYTVKRDPDRFLPFAREGLDGASGILVGSRHTAESLWEAMGDPSLMERTRLGPPGVDVQRFIPRSPADAQAALSELPRRLREAAGLPQAAPRSDARQGQSGKASTQLAGEVSDAPCDAPARDAFARDELAAAEALQRLADGGGPLVAFVGKLIVSKGVDLLIAAWPLVLQNVSNARLAVVGFGAYRDALQQLLSALSHGDVDEVRRIALAGRSLESGDGSDSERPLRHLLAFLDSLSAEEHDRYFASAAGLARSVTVVGRLDHEELADLLPACQALVVPSTFPEAFGMVAAEAAACGVLPISAGHSGLAEVSNVLARELPAQAAGWLSFAVDAGAVRAIAGRVVAWLQAEEPLREDARRALVRVARERWSWQGVARGVIAAARGELDTLDMPR